MTVVGSGLDSPAPEGLPSASVLREDFFLNQWRNDINSLGTRLALFGRSDGRLKAQTAEFSGYVSESSSFCLFILRPHQDRRQKLELSLTYHENAAPFLDRVLKKFDLIHLEQRRHVKPQDGD